MKNLSGQTYRAIIIPPATAISQLALDRLHALAEGGGRVIFLGPGPTLVVGRNALHAGGPPDLSWAVHEPSGALTPRVLTALPPSDVALDQPCPAVKYLHRRWRDADVYFFFNESDQPQARRVTLAGSGQVQSWDANSGGISLARGAAVMPDGTARLALELEPYATLCIVIGALPFGN